MEALADGGDAGTVLGDGGVHGWILGDGIQILARAVQRADGMLAGVLGALDSMEGKLTNAKWAAIGNCSAGTALRDLSDPLARGVLRKLNQP